MGGGRGVGLRPERTGTHMEAHLLLLWKVFLYFLHFFSYTDLKDESLNSPFVEKGNKETSSFVNYHLCKYLLNE